MLKPLNDHIIKASFKEENWCLELSAIQLETKQTEVKLAAVGPANC